MLIFIDESGELSNFQNGSMYFLVCCVVLRDSSPIDAMHELRHALEHEGFEMPSGFHAKFDPWPRRWRVLETIAATNTEANSVALLKDRIWPALRKSESRMYGIAANILLKHVLGKYPEGDHSIVCATYGSGETERRLRAEIRTIINGQMRQRMALARYSRPSVRRHLQENCLATKWLMNSLLPQSSHSAWELMRDSSL